MQLKFVILVEQSQNYAKQFDVSGKTGVTLADSD